MADERDIEFHVLNDDAGAMAVKVVGPITVLSDNSVVFPMTPKVARGLAHVLATRAKQVEQLKENITGEETPAVQSLGLEFASDDDLLRELASRFHASIFAGEKRVPDDQFSIVTRYIGSIAYCMGLTETLMTVLRTRLIVRFNSHQ